MIKTVFDLDVFNLAYKLAMEIFDISRDFPKEERYSLTDQVVRSSRSISANIAEEWGRRIYENEFKSILSILWVRWKKQRHGCVSPGIVNI